MGDEAPHAQPAVLTPSAIDPRRTPMAALRLWEGDPQTLEHVRDGASFVYRFRHEGADRYLRLTLPGWQSRETIAVELEFIVAARRAGVSTPAPVVSAGGALVESVDGPRGPVSAVVFEAAPSAPLAAERWTVEHARALGALMARLHGLASTISLPPAARAQWREDCTLDRGWLPVEEHEAHALLDAIEAELETWPEQADVYGPVHFDVGGDNLFWDGADPWLLDFDDLCFHWYATDLANALWPLRSHPRREALGRACIEAYRSVRALDDVWLARLPTLIRLRAIGVLAWRLHSEWAGVTADEAARRDAEIRRVIAEPPPFV